ncbi:MAG: hypothetical protein DA330_00875 [Nitrososphaera sp.]|nr:hypothetical protein [Nitrososphaera sp.]
MLTSRLIPVLKPFISGGGPIEPSEPIEYAVIDFKNNGGESKNNVFWTRGADHYPTGAPYGIGDTNLSRYPPVGSYFFLGFYSILGVQYQDIVLATQTSVPLANIDAGLATFKLSWWAGTIRPSGATKWDSSEMRAYFYDGSGVLLGYESTGLRVATTVVGGNYAWDHQTDEWSMPVGTRIVRVEMRLHRLHGTFNDAAVDEIIPTVVVYPV